MPPLPTSPPPITTPLAPGSSAEASAFLMHENWIVHLSGVTVTASTEASASLGADNLLNGDPGEPWRATGCTSETVEFTPPPTYEVDVAAVVLVNPNLSPDGTITIEIATEVPGVYDVSLGPYEAMFALYGFGEDRFGVDPAGGYPDAAYRASRPVYVYVELDQVYGAKSLKLTCVDPDNPDGYIEIPVVMAGPIVRPAIGVSHGYALPVGDPSSQIPTEGGGIRVSPRTSRRGISFAWDMLDRDEALALVDDIHTVAGTKRHVFAALRPGTDTIEESRLLVYGLMGAQTDLAVVDTDLGIGADGVFRVSMSITEVRG